MSNKSILSFITIISLLAINCERSKTGHFGKTELIDGILHVYNTNAPARGEIPQRSMCLTKMAIFYLHHTPLDGDS